VFVLFVHFTHESCGVYFFNVQVVKFRNVLFEFWFRIGFITPECQCGFGDFFAWSMEHDVQIYEFLGGGDDRGVLVGWWLSYSRGTVRPYGLRKNYFWRAALLRIWRAFLGMKGIASFD
jgi:hypothetical protein